MELEIKDRELIKELYEDDKFNMLIKLISHRNAYLLFKLGMRYILKNKTIRHLERRIYSAITGWPRDKGISGFISRIKN